MLWKFMFGRLGARLSLTAAALVCEQLTVAEDESEMLLGGK